MRFWWVNHKQTFRHEVDRGFIWCPKRKRNGALNHYYETLREVKEGDLVFSFAFAHVQAVGVVSVGCYSFPKPDEFGKAGEAWNNLGWRADVAFQRFERPVRMTSIVERVARLLPLRYSPVRANGHGNQSAYLAEISRPLAEALLDIAAPSMRMLIPSPGMVSETPSEVIVEPQVLGDWEDRIQRRIEGTIEIPETTRKALVDARRGQGRFKRDVARFEQACRITHVHNPIHLIASHIKPWREATNEERLSAGNGLLLTPSIDHLFDRGLISFADDGEILVSPIADGSSLQKMGVETAQRIRSGGFNSDQRHFLEYHRNQIFLKSAA